MWNGEDGEGNWYGLGEKMGLVVTSVVLMTTEVWASDENHGPK